MRRGAPAVWQSRQKQVRIEPEWRNRFFHLAMRRGRTVANVAMARKLAVGLYWMWRKGQNYEQACALGAHVAKA